MTAADATRLRRELAQRDALIERQAVQIDTQERTIGRLRIERGKVRGALHHLRSDNDDKRAEIAALKREIDILRRDMDEARDPRRMAMQMAGEVFRK